MKIALTGSAPSSIHLGPYQDASYKQFLGGKPEPHYPPSEFIDESWQIWCCSPGAFGVVPRADRWFEVHRWEPGKMWFSPEYLRFLDEFGGPVYTGGPVEGLANGVVYPLARVEAEFSSYFLTSSLALMCALAILEIEDMRKARVAGLLGEMRPGQVTAALTNEEDVIAFFGVDMAAQEEWSMQRPGCQFFVLEALRRGISVYVPRESDLLRPEPVYGISEWDHNYIKATARMRELNGRREAHQKTMQDSANGLQFLSGAIDNMNYMVKTWFSPYGIPAGVRTRIAPGTGLGGGMTMMQPPAVEQPEYVEQPAPTPAPMTATEVLANQRPRKAAKNKAKRPR